MDFLSIATSHRCSPLCIVQRVHGSLFLSICTTARDCNLFPPLGGEESTGQPAKWCESLAGTVRAQWAQDPKTMGKKVAIGLPGTIRP